jgi:chemotaxis signal transduction protein
MKLITIIIGEKTFGFPIGLIREILENYTLTYVSRTDPDILGLLNVRGQIVNVLNPKISLNIDEGSSDHHQIIVLKKNSELKENEFSDFSQKGTSEDRYAFEVNSIGDVFEVNNDQFFPIPGNTPVEESKNLTCVTRINDILIPVINIHALINEKTNTEGD